MEHTVAPVVRPESRAARNPLRRRPRWISSRTGAPESTEGLPKMDIVKDVCVVVPVVILTATVVLGIAVAMSLSSLALL